MAAVPISILFKKQFFTLAWIPLKPSSFSTAHILYDPRVKGLKGNLEIFFVNNVYFN